MRGREASDPIMFSSKTAQTATEEAVENSLCDSGGKPIPTLGFNQFPASALSNKAAGEAITNRRNAASHATTCRRYSIRTARTVFRSGDARYAARAAGRSTIPL